MYCARNLTPRNHIWNISKHIPPPPNYIQSQQAQTASAMMVRQSMGLPGQYKMPLDPDYESDYDSDDDEDENPKDPYVNTCFCCCNLGIGVILGALFFLVSQFSILPSLAPPSGKNWLPRGGSQTDPTRIRTRKTNQIVGDHDQDRDLNDSIGSDLGGTRGDLGGRSRVGILDRINADYYRCHETKRDFSTNQEWDNETPIIIKPIMAYLFLNQIVVTSSIN